MMLINFCERKIETVNSAKLINVYYYFFRLLLKCLPLLEQYILLVQFYLHEQVASFRVTCKILYLQLNVFLDLAANGFCVPKDLDVEENDTNESGERTEKGGMGLADGEGMKDVSDRIESEDQLEDARPADQEQEKQDDKACKEEEKGINMSEDFDSELQDVEKNDNDEEQSDDDEENDLDKEMGQTGEGAEQLDKEIWGDDQEESGEDDHQPENENEEEGTGEQIGEKEMGARDDRDKRKQDNDDDTDYDDDRQEEKKKEINELNEPEVDEDQINPYHGKFQPQPEPEPLDLPEDMNLDEDGKEDNGGEEANPFDIDEMKKPPPEKQDVELEESEETKENDPEEDSSGDENENTDTENRAERTEEELETTKETEENSEENAGAKGKDEEQNRDEKTEEEKSQEKAAPSADDASKQMDAAQPIEETEGSRDTVAQQSNMKDQQETSAENNQEDNNDKGIGQSESAQQESGHSGSSKQETVPAPQNNTTPQSAEKRKNPGESNEDRSLLDRLEPTLKKLKTIYTQDEMSQDKENDASNANSAEMAQHIKDSERFDDYTLDAATEDQVRQQASNDENEEEKKVDTTDVEMHEDKENDVVNDKINEQKAEKISETTDNKCKKDSDGKRNNADDSQTETVIELEGEIVKTMTVQRGNESTFHTMEWSMEESDLSSNSVERKQFEKMLSEWKHVPTTEEATAAWNCLCSVTDTAARDLAEKLRLVLEPTQASRLKGDYKTGKRINMRKIIPYLASQFRKDKIWLRRTKPSKRNYQIALALDDSKSMEYNCSKELALESLSLISKALTYLEVGELSVISFGKQMQILHPLGETFTEQSGSRYLSLYNLCIHLIFNFLGTTLHIQFY